ncbi:TDT family transporter [Vibrio rumoiensis]|uniref:C4-dicarboxylate ABC transporter n=1 Tax=Vibrio rumoiensis 1S-45 TaxID=1188252 RepID=A0A1E5E2U4_9VIBR|nr:TDT family transporter [Vibrio rumoiensis]OEF25872.1 C4-dicarboxylate ABC transporter [Vibrio rumoiensis 1S-45]
MKRTVKSIVSDIPTPIAGLALGIASLGWSWENAAPLHGYGQWFAAAIASVVLVLLAVKFLFHRQLLAQDLAHPVVGSVVPTFAMATMVVSSSLGHFYPQIGDALWLFAVALHIGFLVTFIYHRAKAFEVHHMVPSWFVPPIGIIVADVSFSGNPSLVLVAQAVLMFGIAAYAIMLPVMIYRFIFCQQVPDAAKPTLAIMAAPASLSLAGYLTVASEPSILLVMVLMTIAVLMTSLIYLSFLTLLKLPFSPGYAAFTFPMVIGATALFKTAHWMASIDLLAVYASSIYALAVVELVVASIVVVYVAYRYWLFFKPSGELNQAVVA